MRTLVVLLLAVATPAVGAPSRAPKAPPEKDIDLSGLVLEQPHVASSDPKRALCVVGEREQCEQLCTAGSAPSCARLGLMLARGGADNPLLPVTKFEPDLTAAAAMLGKACAKSYFPACADLSIIDRARNAPQNTVVLKTACKGGYGRACSYLAATESTPKARRALYEQGCLGGDGEACIELVDDDDLRGSLQWANRAFATPASGTPSSLACPEGTKPTRMVSTFDAAFTLRQPRWTCAKYDEQRRRLIEHGPYVEFATEEDERAYPSGVISDRGSNVEGKRDGLRERFDSVGRLVEHVAYKAGEKDGVQFTIRYDDDGEQKEITRTAWVNGEEQGSYRARSSWSERMDTTEQGQYVAGKKSGRWLEIRRGKVVRVETFENGKHTGPQLDFDKTSGRETRRTIYDRAGVLTSDRQFDGRSGRLISDVSYVDGKRSVERRYDDDGLWSVTTYKNDRRSARTIRGPKGAALIRDPDFDPDD